MGVFRDDAEARIVFMMLLVNMLVEPRNVEHDVREEEEQVVDQQDKHRLEVELPEGRVLSEVYFHPRRVYQHQNRKVKQVRFQQPPNNLR